MINTRVKSGKFGRSAKFGQRPCSFHILMIGIKYKLTKQTVKILMRRLITGFPLFANVCPNLPGVRSYPTLPYIPFTHFDSGCVQHKDAWHFVNTIIMIIEWPCPVVNAYNNPFVAVSSAKSYTTSQYNKVFRSFVKKSNFND